MNRATKAPNFTSANAREMGIRGALARKAKLEREKQEREIAYQALLLASPSGDEARKQATLRQLDALDVMIDEALKEKNRNSFLQLAAAKEKLWKLVQPVAGRAPKSRRSDPPPAPIPG